ncbi:hypothetical protein D9Q98_007037 [Chlorella vulgaris]|uniref:Uncharacterized protein n=1 Tax=Chlorella vulgaris TaxID=3077 RepID=A0A9D4YUL9_CHLVU|nr:hypothetical protein D9Q98_007037 [Chlorella vulgaris]
MQHDGLQPGLRDPTKPFTFTGRVTYAAEAEARMVMRALEIDPELRPEAVRRQLSVDGTVLVLEFAAVDMRTLRAAVGTFCDLLGLATRTLEAFGAGAPGLAAAAAGAAGSAAAAREPAAAAAAAAASGSGGAGEQAAAAALQPQ